MNNLLDDTLLKLMVQYRMTNYKRPRDPNQLAKLITDIAVGEEKDIDLDAGKDPAAVELGRKGGKKGGKSRAKALTSEQRKEIAKKAAQKRWNKDETE